jgi:hypothetical protein
MATTSNRSSGSQVNHRGVAQGTTLVDPKSGFPIDVIVDPYGTKRLAVNADIAVDEITVDTRDLTSVTDAVRIEDPVSGHYIKVIADGSINVNVKLDAATDTVSIADGTTGNKLQINPDGSLNVNVTTSTAGTFRTLFNQITSLATGSTASIQTYIVPLGKKAYFQKAEVSGTNIATYEIFINSVLEDRKRTYFGGDLKATFEFSDYGASGIFLNTADSVEVKVTNFRPVSGDFETRFQVIEV